MVNTHLEKALKASSSKGVESPTNDVDNDGNENGSSSDSEDLNFGGFTKEETNILELKIRKQVGKATKNMMPFHISHRINNLKESITGMKSSRSRSFNECRVKIFEKKKNKEAKETKRKLDFVDSDAKKLKQDQSRKSSETQVKTPCKKFHKTHLGVCRMNLPGCYKCGALNHMRKGCKKLMILCYNCNLLGHKSNECHNPKVIKAKPLKSIKEEKVKKTRVPTLTVRAYMMATEEDKVVRDVVTGSSGVEKVRRKMVNTHHEKALKASSSKGAESPTNDTDSDGNENGSSSDSEDLNFRGFTEEETKMEAKEVDKIREELQNITQTNETMNELWKKFNHLIRYCLEYTRMKCSRVRVREAVLLRKKNKEAKETKRKLDFVDRDAKKPKQDQSRKSSGTLVKTPCIKFHKTHLGDITKILEFKTSRDRYGNNGMSDSTGVSVSLGEIFLEGNKFWESNIGDSDNTEDGGKIVGRAITTWGGGMVSYACTTSIFESSCKGEKTSMSKRYLVKLLEESGEMLPGEAEK
nr:hypothetical protein [Tanacetum cinerariifolium]